MERTLLETVRLLGLDLELALILLMLAGAGLVNMARGAARYLGRRLRRRQRTAPIRPLDAWSSQEWGPSH